MPRIAISEGETREEALAKIKEAIELVLEVLSDNLADRSNAEIVNYRVLKGAASHFIANTCITVM